MNAWPAFLLRCGNWRWALLVIVTACLAQVLPSEAGEAEAASSAPHKDHTFSIADFGATGDGSTLATEAINHAIQACAQAGGGQVIIPPGRYVSGTLHLRSHVTLYLSAGATLVGTTNLSLYEQPAVPDFMPEARWGKWHRALIVAEGAEDLAIEGPGIIDGAKVFDPTGEEHMRGPHTINFIDCRRFVLRDFSIVDSANYAIFFQASDDVDIRNIKITGGWDGVHFRGAKNRWCHNVTITDCRFFTGDDSIAGRYWDNVVIANSTLNSACNGLRLIGPAVHLLVDHCTFYGPGQRIHRTSSRANMLSGIILQPGAWDRTEGLLDDVFISENTMRDVAAPVVLWTKPGNPVGRVTISGLNATGVYRAPFSVESWADMPITNVVIRNVTVEFTGGGTHEQAAQRVHTPGVDVRPLPGWGLYARNVEHMTVEDVRLSVANPDSRPPLCADSVAHLRLDNIRFTPVPQGTPTLSSTNVAEITGNFNSPSGPQ